VDLKVEGMRGVFLSGQGLQARLGRLVAVDLTDALFVAAHDAVVGFSYTLLAALINGDAIKLGSLQQDGAVIIPELSTYVIVEGDGGTNVALSGKLQSVLGSASAVDESAVEAIDTGSALHAAFNRTSTGLNTTMEAASYLQFLVTALTTGGSANAILHFDIAYRVAKACG
jgi:hypothetical protein